MLTKDVTLSADEAMCFFKILPTYLLFLLGMYEFLPWPRHVCDFVSLVRAVGSGVDVAEAFEAVSSLDAWGQSLGREVMMRRFDDDPVASPLTPRP